MALRTIREIGDPILEKKAKPVKEVTPHIKELIADMFETMYKANGVGLAAPQIGVLKRIVVIDISEDHSDPHVFINPEIIEQTGEQDGMEGCLSVPGKMGEVKRPAYVKTVAYDENMNRFEIEGTELFARCMCHEFDHLDGIMYTTKTEGGLVDTDQVMEDGDGEVDESVY